jgi:hypothetical protein
VLKWLKSLFRVTQPAGPPQSIRMFRTSHATISQGCIEVDQDAWRIDSEENQTIRLFEVQNPGVEQCMVTYRAKMKTDNLKGRAFLEMWCRLPGRGEFFSKGFHHAVKGTTQWASYEIPFYLKKGQKPDLIKLNLEVEGAGNIWIKDIELLQTPLKF